MQGTVCADMTLIMYDLLLKSTWQVKPPDIQAVVTHSGFCLYYMRSACFCLQVVYIALEEQALQDRFSDGGAEERR